MYFYDFNLREINMEANRIIEMDGKKTRIYNSKVGVFDSSSQQLLHTETVCGI